jgi:hypothetical protein
MSTARIIHGSTFCTIWFYKNLQIVIIIPVIGGGGGGGGGGSSSCCNDSGGVANNNSALWASFLPRWQQRPPIISATSICPDVMIT